MSIASLKKRIKKLEKVNIQVGFFNDHKYPDGTPVAYVATIQEFGYLGGGINIPPRPFMRPAEKNHRKEWQKHLLKQAKLSLKVKASMQSIFAPVGQHMVQDIEDAIINGGHKPLSNVTLLLRKWKKEGRVISKSVVEEARRYLEMFPMATLSKNTTPLNDTGLLIASVSYRINEPS